MNTTINAEALSQAQNAGYHVEQRHRHLNVSKTGQELGKVRVTLIDTVIGTLRLWKVKPAGKLFWRPQTFLLSTRAKFGAIKVNFENHMAAEQGNVLWACRELDREVTDA